jgi:hypothetical protein
VAELDGATTTEEEIVTIATGATEIDTSLLAAASLAAASKPSAGLSP